MKNSQPQTKFTGSYKKKSVHLINTFIWEVIVGKENSLQRKWKP